MLACSHACTRAHTERNIQAKEKNKITFTKSLYAVGFSFLFLFFKTDVCMRADLEHCPQLPQ